MKLTIRDQGGDSFIGTAQLLLESGSWMNIRISGSIDPRSGSVTFTQNGGGATFTGKTNGMRASGTYTLNAQSTPKNWTLTR